MKTANELAAGQTADLLAGITDGNLKKKLLGLKGTLDDPRTKEKQRQRAQAQIDRGQPPVEGQLAELPLWPEHARGVPNSALRGALFAAIQGKNRQYLKREVLAGQEGMQIRFIGMQLDQSDLDVWEQALHLAHYHPLGTRCQFTAHSFLKALGRATGKAQHEWLKDSFARLMGCGVEITHNGWTYGGSLLEFYREENSQFYVLEINPKIRELYNAGWTSTDWEQRKLLKRKPLTLWLHGFLSTHAEPFPMKIETLRKLCGSKTRHLKHFKVNFKNSLDDLKAVGAITDYSFNGGLVSIERTPSASQQKHLNKRHHRAR